MQYAFKAGNWNDRAVWSDFYQDMGNRDSTGETALTAQQIVDWWCTMFKSNRLHSY